jgi:hypothetical protein
LPIAKPISIAPGSTMPVFPIRKNPRASCAN